MSTNYESYRVNFGARLAAARKMAGMNQSQLADSTGIGRATLSRYERGDLTPPTDVLATLAACLQPYGVTTEWLLFGGEITEEDKSSTIRLRSFGSLVALRFNAGGIGEVSMGLPELRKLLRACRDLENERPNPDESVLNSIEEVITHFYEHYDDIDIVADVPIAVHGVKLTPAWPSSNKREDVSKWSVARGMESEKTSAEESSKEPNVQQDISGEGHQIAAGNIENNGGVSFGGKHKK